MMAEQPDDNDDEEDAVVDGGKNLPARPDARREPLSRIEHLEERLRRLDGPLSVSNKLVPYEASDIGDVDERPNPRAKDLDYPEGAGEVTHSHDATAGKHFFFDGPNMPLAGEVFVGVDEETFINDVKEWA